MRRLICIAAAAVATLPGIAAAAEPPCLTPNEFTALAGYTLPSIINGTSQRCGPKLGPDAYLRRSGTDLAARYATRKSNHWPGAKAAFLKLSATTSTDANKIFRDMADAPLQGILDAMMEGMVSQQIPLERCASIDTVVRLLSPLPPENTAELIAVAVGLGSKTETPRVGKISICKA